MCFPLAIATMNLNPPNPRIIKAPANQDFQAAAICSRGASNRASRSASFNGQVAPLSEEERPDGWNSSAGLRGLRKYSKVSASIGESRESSG